MFRNYFEARRVVVTGHTGFKGSWLCEWLLMLGAEVAGYALDPEDHERLFDQLALPERLFEDVRADLADLDKIMDLVSSFQPEVIVHMAAQPLVRKSYEEPIATFATNVMGTVHLLEAVRRCGLNATVVCVTTDKCYENREWLHGYREEDPLGGHDPYSASKGAAEIAISSYRRSFFQSGGKVRVASARAGNVIGGGDWAQDRIVPDCIRSLRESTPVPVRNKVATRPWQHVLEPLSGYLHLASMLATEEQEAEIIRLASAFNFGPDLTSNRTVAELVQQLARHTGGEWSDASDPEALHEASKLNLAIDKAYHLLGWQPVWRFDSTVEMTAQWYCGEGRGENVRRLTQDQILQFQKAASESGTRWAQE